MAFRPLTARAPSVLLREAKPLKAIFGHAQSQLQPAAREHCHVASWREGNLLLIVTDGHWATRLRYQQKRLQRQLMAFDEFASLTRIQFKVQPPTVQQGAVGHTMDLSENAAETIQATADGISDPGLRAALERLAAHTRFLPLLPGILMNFVGLYLLVVEMRILGLLYQNKKVELDWF